MRFDPEYVAQVLNDNFEDAKTQFLSPLMAIHYAHLVMLRDRGIIAAADAHAIRLALDSIVLEDVRCASYDGTCEDLYFYVDRLLTSACGADTAGRLHTARSRNDIDMTMYRMCQREAIANLLEATIRLRTALIDLADRHRETVFAALTHTQPAQPTTVAHYLLAMIEQLERDGTRLRAAYASTNRSPLGACAITGTGFPIDRQLTSDLLGFDGPTGNTYGSIATVDYLLESVAAASVLAAGLGRFTQDMLLWSTAEFGYLRLSDGFVQCSSIMPQKRNPVALEHARAIASRAVGQATAIVTAVHNTPFGDIVDVEDDLQPLVASMFRDTRRATVLLAAALAEAQLNVERLESRAADGGTTLTELADHLVRQHGVPFAVAHRIAGSLLRRLQEKPAASRGHLLSASCADHGLDVRYTDDEVATVMSPRHFVQVRETPGGPAPAETARALDQARRVLDDDRRWLASAGAALAASRATLRERSAAQ